jgi:hypothetical protein
MGHSLTCMVCPSSRLGTSLGYPTTLIMVSLPFVGALPQIMGLVSSNGAAEPGGEEQQCCTFQCQQRNNRNDIQPIQNASTPFRSRCAACPFVANTDQDLDCMESYFLTVYVMCSCDNCLLFDQPSGPRPIRF